MAFAESTMSARCLKCHPGWRPGWLATGCNIRLRGRRLIRRDIETSYATASSAQDGRLDAAEHPYGHCWRLGRVERVVHDIGGGREYQRLRGKSPVCPPCAGDGHRQLRPA